MNYSYTKSIVNIPQLTDEIVTAGLSAPDSIGENDTALTITYGASLTSDQVTTLGGVVSSHVSNPAYVTLATQAAISKLTGYLNNVDPTVVAKARAAIVSVIAPNLPPVILAQINSTIQAQVGF